MRYIEKKRFRWVLENVSSLQDKDCYSPTFVVAGCNWRLCASSTDSRSGYLSLYLELADLASLPSGWRKEVKFRLTLVNNIQKRSNRALEEMAEGQCWFDARHPSWGYVEFLLFDKLHAKNNGFLVRNTLIILADVQILQAITVAEDTAKITETLSCKEGYQATDALDEGSHDDDDASQEDSDDDDGSSHVSDNGGRDTVKITEPLSCKQGDQATDEGSHDDDASQEELDDGNDDASQVSDGDNDDAPNMVDADGTVEENPDDNFLKEIQTAKETVDVNGFQVFTSQVKSVSRIFKRHPDTALDFRPKNQQIRKTYIDELLRLIETLCQSPGKLSDEDLSTANETLIDLIDVGFKLDWLKTKLTEVFEKKKIEQSSVATMLTMEVELQKLKNMVLDFESQLQNEKVKLLDVRAPLSFKDVVC